jgi:hypothetical protein
MMDLLFELLFEFLLQVFGELLFELGLRSLKEPFRKAPNPVLAAIGYALLGTICGALSLLVFRRPMIAPGFARLVYLGLAPVVAGGVMAVVGAWRVRRGDDALRLDSFTYGYLFALAFALVRFVWARSL